VIVDLDGDLEAARGNEHRRAITLVFGLCLAVGSAGLGRDGPAGTTMEGAEPYRTMIFDRAGAYVGRAAPAEKYLALPPNTADALLSFIPDRLANEALPPLKFIPVQVRKTPGLAVDAVRPGDYRMVTWTEHGNVYWLVSDRRDVADLLQLADSLR
jgi:hypothetical protein